MSRIALLSPDTAPISVRSFFQGGQPGPLTASLAQVPELLRVAMPFVEMLLSPSGVDLRTKEIVILRSSAWQRCRYCLGTHSVIAARAGFSLVELRALRDLDADIHVFSEKEKILLAWVDLVVQTGREISDDAMSRLKLHYEESEVVELTMLVGATMMLNRYCTALKLPIAQEHYEALQELGFDDE